MTIHFEGASEKRKELVAALVEATGNASEYLGAPSFDYQVGDYIIHRDGAMEVDELADPKELGIVLQALRAHGFIPTDDTWNQPEEAPDEQETRDCLVVYDVERISLSFPRDDLSEQAIDNLRKLVTAKAPLIRLALELDELPIELEEDRIAFPWLPATAPQEMIDATTQLLAALIKLAKKLRHVTVTERETDNPRYTFRCFLLRLGFIGDEYKTTRKYLMQGVPGNGSKRHIIIEAPESAADAPVEVEHYVKLEAQADIVSDAELAALPDDEK